MTLVHPELQSLSAARSSQRSFKQSFKSSVKQHKTQRKIIICLKISACDQLLMAGIVELLVCLRSFHSSCMEIVNWDDQHITSYGRTVPLMQ